MYIVFCENREMGKYLECKRRCQDSSGSTEWILNDVMLVLEVHLGKFAHAYWRPRTRDGVRSMYLPTYRGRQDIRTL